MKQFDIASGAETSLATLFDWRAAQDMLRAEDGIEWPEGAAPCDVRIERGWPTRDGKFVVEWSFGLGNGARHELFAAPYVSTNGTRSADAQTAELTPHGIRGVSVDLPRWGVRIHSPDRDEIMDHLSVCLDEREMAERLAPFWAGDSPPAGASQSHSIPSMECRPLSYRVGRRATIAYARRTPGRSAKKLVGKTYCDERGERLLRLHGELDTVLAASTNGRVCVPKPVGYISDLRLALFAWVRRKQTDRSAGCPIDRAEAAADALAALHSVEVEGLRDFGVADECKIIQRWHAALGSVDVEAAEATRELVEALLNCADAVRPSPGRTLHRDFYDRQLICDGETITLLDLDTLACGEPCIDLGNLLAHLYLSALRNPTALKEFTPSAGRVLRRYVNRMADSGGQVGENNAQPDRTALAFYWASAMFRVGAVHALRTDTGSYAPSLWQLAERLLILLTTGWPERSDSGVQQGVAVHPEHILGEIAS